VSKMHIVDSHSQSIASYSRKWAVKASNGT